MINDCSIEDDDGSDDMISIVIFETYSKEIRERFIKGANDQREFWSNISINTPISKMIDLATKINENVSNILMLWNKLNSIKKPSIDDGILFAKFNILVLNDIEHITFLEKQLLLKSTQPIDYFERFNQVDSIPYACACLCGDQDPVSYRAHQRRHVIRQSSAQRAHGDRRAGSRRRGMGDIVQRDAGRIQRPPDKLNRRGTCRAHS